MNIRQFNTFMTVLVKCTLCISHAIIIAGHKAYNHNEKVDYIQNYIPKMKEED